MYKLPIDSKILPNEGGLNKECLKNNIVPILITNDYKEFYYRGLNVYEQDIFKSYLDYFKIKY